MRKPLTTAGRAFVFAAGPWLPKLFPGRARKLMLERKVAKIDSPQAQPGIERLPEVKLSAVRLPRDR